MAGKVLIDTSVWITFFRGTEPDLTERVGALLKSGKAAYAGVIALELINGAKGRRELDVLHDAFDAMECLPVTEATFLSAGKLGYEVARKGNTMGAVDLLIAQIAIENDAALVSYDEHFSVIARYSTLSLVE